MFSKAVCVVALAAVLTGEAQGRSLKSWFPWPSGGGKTDGYNLNWVVDDILKSVSSSLIQEKGDQMLLPGSALNSSERLQVLWINFDATAKSSTEGTLKNLSSVIRSSDAGILQEVKDGSLKDIAIDGDLSLKHLEVVYPSAFVKVGFISYTGGLSVLCPDNAFDVAIEFSNDGDKCPATVRSASIKKLAGCSVSLSEGGVLNWFKKHIFSYALGKFVDAVKAAENDALPKILTPIIQRHNICKFLNPTDAA